jgi:cell division septal protein FtsQ
MAERRRLLSTFFILGIPAIIALVVLIGGGTMLRDYVVRSPHFRIKQVEVLSEGPANKDELIRLAAVPPDANLFALSIANVKARVEQHPWVASASISRVLPDRLIIRYSPQVPVAIINLGGMRYINSDGVDFIQVAPGDSLQYPLLQTEMAQITPEAVKPALELLEIVDANPIISSEEISEISISELGTVTLVAPFPPKSIASKSPRRLMTLQFGEGDIPQQWKRAGATLKYLASVGQAPKLLRLELGKKVIVRLN